MSTLSTHNSIDGYQLNMHPLRGPDPLLLISIPDSFEKLERSAEAEQESIIV